MTALRFAKYEGTGNDFVVVDSDGGPQARPVSAADSLAISDRHLGVGADGVLLTGVKGDVPFMRVLNSDGSEAEMCGNGLRCVALHLSRTGRMRADAFVVDTAAGPHAVRFVRRGDRVAVVEVAMRVPSFLTHHQALPSGALPIDTPITVLGTALRVTGVDMGNPHIVTFDSLERAQREVLGPAIGGLDEDGANVGFATMETDTSLRLEVCERGAGWTLACGTGACAAAVAAVETGRAPRGTAIDVRLPGGVLSVVVGERGTPVKLTGPARHVFDGEWPR